MARNESKIVQVAPSGENAKIQELQIFGWDLHGRQEVQQQGDAEGSPDLFGNGYTITTTVHSYVKLHFVRSLETPHLSQIRQLESEYDSLPRPRMPALIPGGAVFVVFWLGPWLGIYLPLIYPLKLKKAKSQWRVLAAKHREVTEQILALPS
jgi:hypothetical protein